ncbi:zinc transporter [Oceanicola sp. 22II-s10i]|uniref:ZIP family metal transporter n=1 Tax=Oceanicola sp. 22II-s10i TaxID=1317116 RepID=UPI000B5257D1|nr:zinc transporter [Oceanicola sp. 22II-s10i]OWU84128.1 zinc transporter [Oceanicola sp. 22II-s10i]
MMLFLVVAIVSAALILGAVWGLYGPLPSPVEGFMVALAGGALIVSVTIELIEPASHHLAFPWLAVATLGGAAGFTLADRWLDHSTAESEGTGLLLAITFDGVPENLALGVALIGAGWQEVAALAGAILLSNLPEAAGGAKEMRAGGMSRGRALGLWSATAGLLAAAAVAGNLLLRDAGPQTLAAIRCVAAGAVTASLATEVFPQAFREDHYGTGIAVAIGLLTAFGLSLLAG